MADFSLGDSFGGAGSYLGPIAALAGLYGIYKSATGSNEASRTTTAKAEPAPRDAGSQAIWDMFMSSLLGSSNVNAPAPVNGGIPGNISPVGKTPGGGDPGGYSGGYSGGAPNGTPSGSYPSIGASGTGILGDLAGGLWSSLSDPTMSMADLGLATAIPGYVQARMAATALGKLAGSMDGWGGGSGSVNPSYSGANSFDASSTPGLGYSSGWGVDINGNPISVTPSIGLTDGWGMTLDLGGGTYDGLYDTAGGIGRDSWGHSNPESSSRGGGHGVGGR